MVINDGDDTEPQGHSGYLRCQMGISQKNQGYMKPEEVCKYGRIYMDGPSGTCPPDSSSGIMIIKRFLKAI